MKKKVLVLGSTGSIGRATLEVIENQIDDFEVSGIACRDNIRLLNTQIARFRPRHVCIFNKKQEKDVHFDKERLFTDMGGILRLINTDADIVVNALPGSVGLMPTIEALRSGKILALANKESLVMAGRIVSRLVRESGGRLIPIDSEHSALYQLLKNINPDDLKSITITASGGPFRKHRKKALEHVSPEEAMNHPTWKMGTKVTLDSATLMNKGFEVIEARWLFHIGHDRIKVLVHPESIIHGMVEFIDGSFTAYLAVPDMKIPISYAINEGKIRGLPFETLRLHELKRLTFYAPDTVRFPSLRLAFEALDSGDSALVALNAASEVTSQAFIEGRIRFTEMPVFIEEVLNRHPLRPIIEDIEGVWEIHDWAKGCAEKIIKDRK
ncbi:MAG: 1-deoxy-D-xylulose-5-phosphate reductoisomerase [Syntrophorhabdaceae bacterium]|nr:1-deoxy-D-xylulose-5-phosphate reductoisomerase [Syntrophorhabdales bacterium]MBP9560419.1 1-deoxy-D-xylulose-5-phosphate reductoisomerase [Syntrophorhabdaceae bacterium]